MAFEQYGSRLYCRRPGADGDYCVTVRDGKLILTLADDDDIFQLWYKDFGEDDRYMLRNKATNKVVKYSGVGDQLELVDKPSVIVDQPVLWTNSEVKRNDEFTFIRTSSNVDLVMDVWTGLVKEGALVTIHPNAGSDNELWKYIPYSPPDYKLYCKRQGQGGDYCVSVRDGKLVLARPEDNDITQVWHTDNYDNGFVLINKASGKPVQHSKVGVQLKLVDKPHDVDQSVLWTNSEDVGDGYTFIRTKSDVNLVMDAWTGHIYNGTLVSIYRNVGSNNEHWKLVPYSPPVSQLSP
ncbi:hypothetical protein RND81_14G228600 [Saponaria officinalis]|uniref:Uncharacterized protein n=1 Tax=Saponaria officinalis TaxID=3572 RepID=A0AAW1GU71_SAPOF